MVRDVTVHAGVGPLNKQMLFGGAAAHSHAAWEQKDVIRRFGRRNKCEALHHPVQIFCKEGVLFPPDPGVRPRDTLVEIG